MPSGSKKRKAAKKKKEQEATTNNNNASSSTNSSSNSNPLGNDDPKSQDERESDGGEDGSPASQDHHDGQHPFKEGSEESETRDPLPVRSFDTEKSMEEVAHDAEAIKKVEIEDVGAIETERELKFKEDSGSQSISIEHIEFVKESHDGSSSSSGSSSDDESQVVEKKYEEAAYDSISEATSRNGKPEPVDSCPAEVLHGTEKLSFGEADKSVVDIVSFSDSVKPLVTATEEVISVKQIDSIESSSAPDVVETRMKEGEESKRTEEKVFPLSEDHVGAPSTVLGSVANGNEGKVLPTSDAPIAETSHGAENIRDSKIPDSSENQPPIAPAPRAAERTSWMNCCGLLDVLTGSSR